MPNDDLTALLQSGGTLAAIAVDVSTSAMQPPAQGEGRRREVEQALRSAGADDALVGRLLGAVVQVAGAADPVGVAAVAGAATVVQQPTPGDAPVAAQVEVGPVPDLSALLRGRERAVPVLAVEARAGGGVIHVLPVPGLPAASTTEVTGEALAQNARALADRTARAAKEAGAAVVVVLGDPRAAELLSAELSRSGDLTVAALGKDTAAAGADPDDLTGAVRLAADGLLADAHRALVDRLSADSHRLGAIGLDQVVAALQGAAVDQLLVGPEGVDGELVALDAPPWVATSEADALGAGVVGRVPAAAALLRAAVLTDAAVRFPAAGVLPAGESLAAHLRRPLDDQEASRG